MRGAGCVMLFDGWYDLWRILVVGVAAYGGLVVLLRLTGKRTLSKMNAFDLVVTVALGSTLASALLSSEVSLSEGLLAFALLCSLQYVVAYASVRSRRFQDLVKSEPTLLFFRGAFLPAMMVEQRVTDGGGLPVDDRHDPRRSLGGDHHVHHVVVAVHDRGHERPWPVGVEPRRHPVEAG